ncbi:hypothetical protein ILUMI_18965 [Ignelater luminosus]|uniref:Peptidase S1 domain-containing protein n=1 Tax=Ignelater luminosus TaxID=2038154 RepID=A0A8K0CIZ1_IGNLU|nr:hypothetical protein ILUMI_18965 [Ignelater luminosus]
MSIWKLFRLLTIINACLTQDSPRGTEACAGTGKCKMGKNMQAYKPLPQTPYTYCSFVALLYNTRTPDVLCLGAIITRRWILDNCLESPGRRYERARVGVMHQSFTAEYNIIRGIQHENYELVSFRIPRYNTTYMWAATNALILHLVHKNIVLAPEYVQPIPIHPTYDVPDTAFAIYLHNNVIICKEVYIIDRGCCNYHFNPYFRRGYAFCLEENQYCVFPISVTSEECCQSQALMVYNNKLIGVMAWSTGCSPELGIDPWVFSHLRFFMPWIKSKTF